MIKELVAHKSRIIIFLNFDISFIFLFIEVGYGRAFHPASLKNVFKPLITYLLFNIHEQLVLPPNR